MKLALAQLSMEKALEKNAAKSLRFCDEARDCDLLFFPEIQLSPFFPQYEKQNADAYCLTPDAPVIASLCQKAVRHIALADAGREMAGFCQNGAYCPSQTVL